LRLKIGRLLPVQPPAGLRPVVAAVDLDCQAYGREIEIDHPVAGRPFAPIFAAQNAAAESIEYLRQRRLGACGRQAPFIGSRVQDLERR
jgi:hypothetical protein